jgi:FMN phosphatase YigB (HAD superfamily)
MAAAGFAENSQRTIGAAGAICELTLGFRALRSYRRAAMTERFVTFFDVDNTLLDNDAVHRDLSDHLEGQFGAASRDRYWAIFENLRAELGYADYLGALQRYRREAPNDTRLLLMSGFLMDYPFADRLYPGALDAIGRLGTLGPTVILSDGDVVFQPRKVQRSGIWEAVQCNVLIYIHKEEMLDQVSQLYPAQHYIMVDDKLRILTAMKQQWGDRLTTILPRQGHYALDPKVMASYAPADLTIEGIGELATIDFRSIPGLVQS